MKLMILSMKVMLADDSDYVRLSLRKMLSRNPMIDGIIEAETISKAKEVLELEMPDVLILDLSFPEGSGFEVLGYARAKGLVKIIVILTNYPGSPMKNRSFREGADFFFDKSNEFMKVIDVINKLSKDCTVGDTNEGIGSGTEQQEISAMN